MIKRCIAAIVAVACLCGARIGYTASDDDFYKGKTIRLIVAFSAGGGYDAYSRAIGRHLGKHIPGETGWADYRQQCRRANPATDHGRKGH